MKYKNFSIKIKKHKVCIRVILYVFFISLIIEIKEKQSIKSNIRGSLMLTNNVIIVIKSR